ncbi:MAG: hypothetical protein WHU54_04035 [Candidatus Bathyarchaeia archaeon]
MSINACKAIITLSLILLAVSAFLPLVHGDQAAAAATLASAKAQIVSCYRAAEEAESAGANITALVAVLNDAGLLLSRAEYAYSIRDFDDARDLATQSLSLLSNFVAEADVLKENAVAQRNQDFLINVLGSTAGTFAVLGVGGALWVALKRREKAAEAQANRA